MFFYGLLLIICGVVGYLYHPETAITALISGGSSGFLSLILSWQLKLKAAWAYPASITAAGVFILLYGQRAVKSWEFASSMEANTVIFALSAVMCLGSILTVIFLWMSKRP